MTTLDLIDSAVEDLYPMPDEPLLHSAVLHARAAHEAALAHLRTLPQWRKLYT